MAIIVFEFVTGENVVFPYYKPIVKDPIVLPPITNEFAW